MNDEPDDSNVRPPDEHGHCCHCDDTCRKTTGWGLHWDGRGAYWLPGACQACAEAERQEADQ